MPPPRVDQRDPSHPKYGKPGVTYPYGDLRFPRIVEAWNARKEDTRRERAYLSPHPDKLSYPGALLISQNADKGSDYDQNFTAVYETLPGPIFVDIRTYRETGIPMLTAKRRVAANANYVAGEFAPTAINIVSITDNGDGATCTVTLASPHDLPPKCWVIFGGTNSTPQILGNHQIVGVPSATTITIGIPISNPGTAAGAIRAVNPIQRELQPVPDNANILVKIDTMVAVPGFTDLAARVIASVVGNGDGTSSINFPSVAHGLNVGDWALLSGTNSVPVVDGPRKVVAVTSAFSFKIEGAVRVNGGTIGTMTPMGPLATYNEDFHCQKDYDFPDFLKAINFYNSGGNTAGFNGYNFSFTSGGTIGLPMQDGYRGPCRARRLRCFFVGPPPNAFSDSLKPTFIMPSSGTVVIQSVSQSRIFTPDLLHSTDSNSTGYRTVRVPHCLTGINPTITGGSVGADLALATLDLPQSVPAGFTVGDIIVMMGQPSKYDAGALWEVVIYFVTVPYTSGSAPP